MPARLLHLPRLVRTGWILAREGVFADVDPTILPPPARPLHGLLTRLARRGAYEAPDKLARAMTRLGPSYVKLGQVLAARPDIIGARAAKSLEYLQDRAAPFPQAEAVAIVERALGAPIDELFAEFGPSVAAASIAQVHRAKTRAPDGSLRDVAVKIMRPGVERSFARDLDDMRGGAEFAERHSASARRLRLRETVETVARSVRLEMDFRLEGAAASEFSENIANDEDFTAPEVDWDRTAREVLTIDWVRGLPLSDMEAIEKAGLDLPKIGRSVIQNFLRQALRDGFFHADMHPGNLFVDETGRLAAIDFGIMGRLGHKERRFLAEILYGFIKRDYRRVAQVHFDAGYVPKDHSIDEFAQAIRAIGEPIHSRTADQISMAKLLTLLFEVTALFDMRTRPELLLLQKTMVVVEGVGRKFDPRLNMWATAEPVARGWVEAHLGLVGKSRDLREAAEQGAHILARVPALLERAEQRLQEGAAGAHRAVESHWLRRGALALWLLVALLVLNLLWR